MNILKIENNCLPSIEALTSVMSTSDSNIATSCPPSFSLNYFADELFLNKNQNNNDVIKECRNVFLEQYLERNKVGRRAKCLTRNRTKLNSESVLSQPSNRRLSRRQSCDLTSSNQRLAKRNSEILISNPCKSIEIDSNNLFSQDLNLSQSCESSLNEYLNLNSEFNNLTTNYSPNGDLYLNTFTDNEVGQLYACFDNCHLSNQFEINKQSDSLIDFCNQTQDLIL